MKQYMFTNCWTSRTWETDLQGVVDVFDTQMFNQQQEDWEGVLGQVWRVWELRQARQKKAGTY